MDKSVSSYLPIQQSGIRAATIKCEKLGGINLGQGVCDLPVPDSIKLAAINAINNNKNTYAAFEGVYELREKIAEKLINFNKVDLDHIDEVMIGHGSTGAFISAIKAITHPGDEIILIEPFYGYHKHILDLHQITIKTVTLDLDSLSLDIKKLETAISSKTKGIILCNPANPSGKVFTKNELLQIGRLAIKNKLYIITDEIYEYITYPHHEHISIASLENFKDYVITISGLSKTYNMTGWRVGYAYGSKEIIRRMALIHDLIYICPPSPLQHAAISISNLPYEYFEKLRHDYLIKRDLTLQYLKDMGFKSTVPQGAYYIMVDYKNHPKFHHIDDIDIANLFLEKAHVAVVTGSSFYQDKDAGSRIFRICYALNRDKVTQGLQQLLDFTNNY